MYSSLLFIIYIIICSKFRNGLALPGQHGANPLTPGNDQCRTDLKPCTFETNDPDLFNAAGLKGEKGERGLGGATGLKGEKGTVGAKGDKGIESGPAGPPGLPGLDGNCPCSYEYDPVGDTEQPGSKSMPLMKTCCSAINDAEYKVSSKDYHYMGPNDPFLVKDCTKTRNKTCIKPKKSDHRYYNYNNKNIPFWISELGYDLSKIYDVSVTQLEWIHKRSKSARQVLRYYCNNSVAYSNDLSSLSLLGWNDVVFDPPNTDSPFTYTVESNGCSMPGSSGFSEIIISTPSAKRLPIRDVLIRDVRNGLQEFYLENVDLCFGC